MGGSVVSVDIERISFGGKPKPPSYILPGRRYSQASWISEDEMVLYKPFNITGISSSVHRQSKAVNKLKSCHCKENLHVSPEELKQHHHSQVAVSRAALKGRYARSRAGWISKERSTPENIDLEKHAEMFKCPLPQPPRIDPRPYVFSGRPFELKKRKPPEVRNALRERRMAFKQSNARNHAEVALRKYNRANNTKFELVEVRVISIFYEFGGGGIHYNFTAKETEDHHSADAGSTKLFFSEVNYWFHNENDVLLCCIVGENDAGHCYACENYQPVVHPSSQAYGGGSSTCIDYPGSDGDSTDSD